jgi:hypothetical protein
MTLDCASFATVVKSLASPLNLLSASTGTVNGKKVIVSNSRQSLRRRSRLIDNTVERHHQRIDRKYEPAIIDFGLEVALTRLQFLDLLVDRIHLEEGRLNLLRREDRSQRHDQRDQHAGRDCHNRRGVPRTNSKEAEPAAPDLMADAIPDVSDRAGDHHDEREVSDAPDDLDEVHTNAARRKRANPIAVNRMFGIQAQSAANPRKASPANEQIVMTT